MVENKLRPRYPVLATWLDYLWLETGGDEECKRLREERKELLHHAAAYLPLGLKYLNGWMHDSWTIGATVQHKRFELSMNDFAAHCFCEALLELQGRSVPHENVVMPVTFKFCDIKRFTVCHITKSEKILPLNLSRYLPLIDEWLDDDISMLQPERVEMGILFTTHKRVKKAGHGLVLDVAATNLQIVEGQRKAFISLCGEGCARYFDAFNESRLGIGFDYSSSLEFLRSNFTELRNR